MNSWQIGKVRVSQVVEMGPVPTSPKFLFKDPPADLVARHAWLKPHFANDRDRLLSSIHCFVIESAGRRIVVDTCVGNDKKRENPGWNQHIWSGKLLTAGNFVVANTGQVQRCAHAR